jgi:hypothetical protein
MSYVDIAERCSYPLYTVLIDLPIRLRFQKAEEDRVDQCTSSFSVSHHTHENQILHHEVHLTPPETYEKAPELRDKCQQLIEKSPLTIDAKKRGASDIQIIGGVHKSDLDKTRHLTIVYNKGIKGRQHIPVPGIPTVNEHLGLPPRPPRSKKQKCEYANYLGVSSIAETRSHNLRPVRSNLSSLLQQSGGDGKRFKRERATRETVAVVEGNGGEGRGVIHSIGNSSIQGQYR